MCVGGRRLQSISLSSLQLSALQKPSFDPLDGVASSAFDFNPSIETTEGANCVEEIKAVPKRRRKPQKPGKTAKNNERHFVVHHYHDHSQDVDCGECSHHFDESSSSSGEECLHRRRGGVSVPFPMKLHEVLDQVEADGFADIVSWQSHGRCFMIHKPKEFVDYIMQRYFRQTKLTSFQRQLNLYGFNRITRGPDSGAYYSEYFLRWRVFLCKHMIRTKVKGTCFKAASNPEHEPDFYSMPIMTPLPEEMGSFSTDEFQTTISSNNSFLHGVPTQSPSLDSVLHGNSFPDTYAISNSLSQFLSTCHKSELVPNIPVASEVVTSSNCNAVNDLYDLDDFPLDWSENFDAAFELSLNDDVKLGHMLEKLLAD